MHRAAGRCRIGMAEPCVSEVFVRVALDHPLPTLFDYRCLFEPPPQVGQMVQVPFGKRSVVGLVCEVTGASEVAAERLREVQAVCADCPPLSPQWLALVAFAAEYYQRALGEVALPSLPQPLRDASRWGRLLALETY